MTQSQISQNFGTVCQFDHASKFLSTMQYQYSVGWSKNPVSSQTDRLMAGTKFSDYLGLNYYKKAKKTHFIHLNFAYRPQILKYIP